MNGRVLNETEGGKGSNGDSASFSGVKMLSWAWHSVSREDRMKNKQAHDVCRREAEKQTCSS